jgi:hypothetical protein
MIVEHKHPHFFGVIDQDPVEKETLVAKVLKTRENRKMAKRSWKKPGRQIKGSLKPETLKRSILVNIEIRDGDGWRKVEDSEIM